MGVNKNQKRRGRDHESEISFANRTVSSYRINVSVVTSRGRVLDDMPSRINGNSEPRGGETGCNCYDGTGRLAWRKRTPAKEPETAAKASTTSVPAKPKAVPTATGAITEPAASPEELTQAKKTEATAKASPTSVPAKPKAVPTPAAATTEPGAPPEERTPAKGPDATASGLADPSTRQQGSSDPRRGQVPLMEPPPVPSTTPAPAPAPTQDAVAPSTPPLPPR